MIKEFGVVGGGVIGLFVMFRSSFQDTIKQNNDMMNHLMETNKQLRDTNRSLHDTNWQMGESFNKTLEKHSQAIQELTEEIRKMSNK